MVDYPKYLPANIAIKTDEDVVVFAEVYKAKANEAKACLERIDLITAERKECVNKAMDHVHKTAEVGVGPMVADCKQANDKAKAKGAQIEKELGADNIETFMVSIMGNEVACQVSDFAKDGMFLCNQRFFVYTTDKNYAEGETFRVGGFYKLDGYYKYTNVVGGTNSVPAYRATKYKISDVDYKTYLKDKTIECN